MKRILINSHYTPDFNPTKASPHLHDHSVEVSKRIVKKEREDEEAYDLLPAVVELDAASTGIGGFLLKPGDSK